MPEDRLRDVLDRARAARPDVRAAALLHLARLASWTDREAGRRLLDEAWAVLRGLDDTYAAELEGRAWLITAAVDPSRVPPTLADEAPEWRRDGDLARIVEVMVQHGHADAAIPVLLGCGASALPLWAVPTVVMRSGREDAAPRLMARALECWRASAEPRHEQIGADVLRWGWKYLPAETAHEAIRDFVRRIEERREPINSGSTLDPEGRYTLSGRTAELFAIIDIVQDLDPPLAQRLADSDPQLRSTLERFPRGMRTIQEEAEERARQRPPGAPRGYFFMGSGGDFPYLHELHDASDFDEFARLLHWAEEKYAADTDPANPNGAPMEYWPSVSRYRQILSAAAKRFGDSARSLLDEIPDPDVRLLVEIEMLATAQGLPDLPSETRFWPTRSYPR